MRISDWSSDVCSSDLLGVDRIAAPHDDEVGLHHLLRIGAAPRAAGEIGRASCRERVCQYVSISVVAVSLKKNIKKNKAHVLTTNNTSKHIRFVRQLIKLHYITK